MEDLSIYNPDDSKKNRSRSDIYISMKNDKNQMIEILVPIEHSDLVVKLIRGDN